MSGGIANGFDRRMLRLSSSVMRQACAIGLVFVGTRRPLAALSSLFKHWSSTVMPEETPWPMLSGQQ